MHHQSFLLLALVSYVSCASIGSSADIDRNEFPALNMLKFPKIPGFNAPLTTATSGADSSSSQNATSENTSSSSQDGATPEDRNATNANNREFENSQELSRISNNSKTTFDDSVVPGAVSLPDLSELPKLPGLSDAMEDARSRAAKALGIANDFSSGIQEAMNDAISSSNPAAAIQGIISAIIAAYTAVAENCPLIITGTNVMREANQLVSGIIQAGNNMSVSAD